MKDLIQSLIYIQQHLIVPKDQFNSFGKYNYRSLESILAAIKPLLRSQNCGIRFEDEVIELGGRTFLKTTLYFFNDKGESITTSAIAEHTATKTGMDAAQITGAASSYARKYAMNAMFAIDDTKDVDSDSYHREQTKPVPEEPAKKAPTRRTRTTSAPAQATTPATKDPRYAAIEAALAKVNDIDSLIELYEQHKMEVENNPDIKAMFSRRKQEIHKSTVITF